MKKLFSLSVAAMLGLAAFAQDTIPNRQNSNPANRDTIPATNRNWNDSLNKSRTMDSSYQKRNYPDSLTNDTSSFARKNEMNDSMSTNTTTTDSLSTANTTQTSTLNKADSMTTSAKATTTTTTTTLDSTVVLSDRVIMRDDAMFVIKDGQTNSLTETYKLESGATVTSDGTVTYPSGKTVKLKNGQFIEITKSTSSDKDKDEMTTGDKKLTKTEKSTKTTKKTTKKTKPRTD
ncbi:MAG: hypothetical protein Q7T76_19470 [Ferruginibacter sp.]|nr:hypothetical protein [Ferruginibacter sp.]